MAAQRSRRGSRRRPRAGDERSRQDRIALIIAVAAGVALLALVLVIWLNPQTDVDARTGCLRSGGIPENHTVILIDQTDSFSPEQIDYVKRLIVLEYNRLERYDLFTVVGLNPAGANADERPRIDFSRCRMQRGDEANVLVANPDLIEQDFRQLTGAALQQAFAAMSDMPISETSPLLETVDDLAGRVTFGSPEINRRLVIVSDMAQFSPDVTHYPPSGSVFVMPANSNFRSSRNLQNVAVRIHYVQRDSLEPVQTPDHLRYWQTYFQNSGVTDLRIGWGISNNPDELAPLASEAGDLQPRFRPADRAPRANPVNPAPQPITEPEGPPPAPTTP